MQSTSEWASQQSERVSRCVAEALACLARAQEHLRRFAVVYRRAP